jgi:hypothetical protein
MNPGAVCRQLDQGVRPLRPLAPDCSDAMWALVETCWRQEPELRPSMTLVLTRLKGFVPRTVLMTVAAALQKLEDRMPDSFTQMDDSVASSADGLVDEVGWPLPRPVMQVRLYPCGSIPYIS